MIIHFSFGGEEGWVVCRAFKKRTSSQTRTSDGWDSSYFYDEQSGISSIVDAFDYIPRQSRNFASQNFICKQETEADHLNILHPNHIVQLPQLESPSIPLINRPTSISLVSDSNEDEEQIKGSNNTEKVTDWRALDKFVASQLSQEDSLYDGGGVSGFGAHHNSDMALVLLQSSREEGNKFNGFSSSSSEGDIGICIFEK
ncbi:hypothetical protein HHK36_008607 [Tetracentron sinense]|uniref:Uncharacterized protein n=1 Tax=Tetracentron sinense TaxID=13715 RepID=A0A835DNI0_TETSI|nr:hypothetical protein HHK36_008607 [Tetracentron sinense]